MRRTFSRIGGMAAWSALAVVLGGLFTVVQAEQPQGAEDAAKAMLAAGRRAFNEGQYPVAAERFREFIKQYGSHKDVPAARFGLALVLVEGPEKNYKEAADLLQPVAGREDFADRPLALYYLGAATRGLGNQAADAVAKPAEAAALRGQAQQRFDEAAKPFAAAAGAFAAKLKAMPANDAGRPVAIEWFARSRADQCEMLLRVGKFREAAEAANTLAADPALKDNPYRAQALYHLGYAQYNLKDYPAAGRALSQLAPFQQDFGPHARYLMGRTHHLMGERPEAAVQYDALVAEYGTKMRKVAETLKNPAALKPEQKAALEALVNTPTPDYIVRAAFYQALLMAEDGRHAEAAERFAGLLKRHAPSPLAPEMQLRLGYCQMLAKNYPAAVATLTPLREHPQLGDQAMWWIARSQLAAVDPANAPAFEQAARAAVDVLRTAADRAGALGKTDPAAKVRRGDILLELGDALQLLKQYDAAAALYAQTISEQDNPDRDEEALQRQVSALHLAGKYKESDELAQKFERMYPKSTLLGAVLFRVAENAYLGAIAAANDPNQKDREAVNRRFNEAITRYQRLLKQFPEFPHANLARQGMAMALYRLGRYAETVAALQPIPEPDRVGPLATVPYLMADCQIRALPQEADDAVRAGIVVGQADQAAKLLDTFAAANPKAPEAPDALLKMGYCYQRIGVMMVDPAERQKQLTLARTTYEKFLHQFPQHAAMPTAVLERAKCLVLLGDPATAMNELRRFTVDPLKNSPVAPLAVLRLLALLRAQGKAAEGLDLVAQCRARHEAAMLKDPERADWAPMLQYEHALTLKEAAKGPEAKAIFDGMVKQFPGRSETVNAIWRSGQCRREELFVQMNAARKVLANPAATPEEAGPARDTIARGGKDLRLTAEIFLSQAEELGKKAGGSAPHQRLLYEAAWCYRLQADCELDAARAKQQQAGVEKAKAGLAKESGGQAPPSLSPPVVPLAAVPVQPSEKLARDQYERLIKAAPATPLAVLARFELAELLGQRGDYDTALERLADAMENNPAPELSERIRLRLAAIFLAKNDAKSALTHIHIVRGHKGSPLAGEAAYLAGEAYIQQAEWAKAIEQLVPFRDAESLRTIRDTSDRALLRLAYAYGQAGQWEPSRQAAQALIERYPQSVWADEARFSIGWALQNLKQFDPAVAAYTEVVRRTAAESAARAQLQIGLCRLEQKRQADAAKALLAVVYTYDYPDCSAAASCEAARAYLEMNQPAEARNWCQRVIKEWPKSTWADVARKRLTEIK